MLTPRQSGFTLIEVLVAMAVLALLLAMGAPSLSAYSENAKIRSAAEALAADLANARAEAVRRNAPVEFIVTNVDGTEANVNTTSLSAGGTNYIVRTPQDPNDASNTNYTFIAGKNSLSGTGRSNGTSTITMSGDSNGTGINQLRFTNLSGLQINAAAATSPAIFSIKNPAIGACATSGAPGVGVRCMNVYVSATGQVKVCDPTVAADALTDSRRCPT